MGASLLADYLLEPADASAGADLAVADFNVVVVALVHSDGESASPFGPGPDADIGMLLAAADEAGQPRVHDVFFRAPEDEPALDKA